jgi:hypothetical protein
MEEKIMKENGDEDMKMTRRRGRRKTTNQQKNNHTQDPKPKKSRWRCGRGGGILAPRPPLKV